MILINIANIKEYFVPLKKSTGEEQHTCPECSESRKKKTVKCFSFNHDKQTGYCSHCNITLVIKREVEIKKEYKKPVWRNQTSLSTPVVSWFEQRGITQQTLIEFKVTEGNEWMPQLTKEVNTIQFNYLRNNELINIKYRDGLKNFKLHKDSELILYNLDSIKESEIVIICEGEIDCMSIAQAGYKNVVSVPNGAGTGKINLEYLDNCIEYFLNKKTILLATDDDLPGRNVQEQLAERLGKDRCYKIKFKDSKDANECLQKHGIQGIIEAIADKREFPLEGVFTIEDYSDEINEENPFGGENILVGDGENLLVGNGVTYMDKRTYQLETLSDPTIDPYILTDKDNWLEARKLKLSELAEYIKLELIYPVPFTNDSLNADYQFIFYLPEGKTAIGAFWVDNEGFQRLTAGSVQIEGLKITINCNDIITGTHTLNVIYG